ncbi:ABC transporter ATP-binding protein [Halopseudomonas nanhaiensis]|uniref:ABC transporter ATP-binding protein n=1 Tax=Halopseudomonas nanhaiensis TaxID=2830842 RepID=UPI001CBC1A4E|nr:ABC transporter ATP-binding protein [Halopseudomonas nanhaiensis]UAW99812.1 ABC transporter ATP-binding protein [Halopseudomonas nanhaiensis]
MQLKFEDVRKRFGSLEVIQRFSAEVAEGELVALVGPSGCGKSTLLHLAAGLEKPTEGRVLGDGKLITAPNPQRTLVFQEHALYPWLTLQGNVAMALELQNVGKKEAYTAAEGWLERVGLKGFEHYYPHQVSGGMRQRTALARAFMVKPEILLLDEPFGALDALTRMALQDVLHELIEEHKPSVMLVTHDVDEALYLADRIMVFSKRPTQVLKEFSFEHCERSHDLSGVAPQRKEILALLGIKTEVHA